jgi:hypothetical protein
MLLGSSRVLLSGGASYILFGNSAPEDKYSKFSLNKGNAQCKFQLLPNEKRPDCGSKHRFWVRLWAYRQMQAGRGGTQKADDHPENLISNSTDGIGIVDAQERTNLWALPAMLPEV